MPCGIKMEVVQGINFLQVVNTTLYAITMEFSNNFSLENHNFYILTSSSSSFLELFYKKIANVRKILNMTFTWFTFILGYST
jgi:predicted nucleic-acid-binding Zn-ribbon protein